MMTRGVCGGLVLSLMWACGGPSATSTHPTTGPKAKTGEATRISDGKFEKLSDDLLASGALDKDQLAHALADILATDPQYAPARFNQAVLLEQAGDTAKAQALYDTLANEKFVPAQENQAALWVKQGQADAAEKVYRKIIASHAKNVTSRLALARLLLSQDKHAEAIRLAREALGQEPAAIEAFRMLARGFVAQNNIPMAELVIARALTITKDDPELFIVTAEVLSRKGDLSGAMEALNQAVVKSPKNVEARVQLANIALTYRDFGTAQAHLSHLLADAETHANERSVAALQVALATCFKGMGRFAEARAAYDKVLAREPNHAAALWGLAILNHYHLDNYDEAMSYYEKFKSVADNKVSKEMAEVDSQIADASRKKNDKVLAKEREDREQRYLVALQNACEAVQKKAPVEAQAIGNEDERIGAAWQLLGEAQGQLAQDPNSKAVEEPIACAVAILPKNTRANKEACAPLLVTWAQLLYQAGRPADALRAIRSALKCDAENPDAQTIEEQLKALLAPPTSH